MAENHEIANDWSGFVQLPNSVSTSDEFLIHRSGQIFRATAESVASGTLGQQAIETGPASDQAVEDGNVDVLNFSTPSFTTGPQDFSVSSGRVQVFKPGIYAVSSGAIVEASGAAITNATLVLTKNATIFSAINRSETIASSANSPLNAFGLIRINAGDIVDARISIVQAGVLVSGIIRATATVVGLSAAQINRLSIVRVG